MSRLTDSRTRVVTWLKLVLPLVALGLLSTLFLLARTTDPDV
jgi:lipopolysaccharide export system protein LptC